MKSPIGVIFCRNMLMDSLQGQLKNGLAEVIFHGVVWVNYSKKRLVSPNIVMKSPIGLIFCRNMLMNSFFMNNFFVWWDMWLLLHIQTPAWEVHCSINFTKKGVERSNQRSTITSCNCINSSRCHIGLITAGPLHLTLADLEGSIQGFW